MKPAMTTDANIYHLRKGAHLAQDDLASPPNAAKAPASQRETSQNRPDIELPPTIATYSDAAVGALVKCSVLEGATANPVFAPLAENPRFQGIMKNLERIAR